MPVGPSGITAEIDAHSGAMRVRATLNYFDGTQQPMDMMVEAYKLAMLVGLASRLQPENLADPDGGPGPADAARMLAAFFNVLQMPPPPVQPQAPTVLNPPDVHFG